MVKRLIDVSLFAKDDRIVMCHPKQRCFYLCPADLCMNNFHFYNLTQQKPLPDGNVMDFLNFTMLRRRELENIAYYQRNLKKRIAPRDRLEIKTLASEFIKEIP